MLHAGAYSRNGPVQHLCRKVHIREQANRALALLSRRQLHELQRVTTHERHCQQSSMLSIGWGWVDEDAACSTVAQEGPQKSDFNHRAADCLLAGVGSSLLSSCTVSDANGQ